MAETESVRHRDEILVEVAVDTVAGARVAAQAGAACRIELCSALGEGGLTPSLGLLEQVLQVAAIPVFAMLRPRAGDSLYDADERGVVLRDLDRLAAAGAAGFVFGALDPDGNIDRDITRAVVAAAAPLPVTFHRSFDLCADPFAALTILAELGVRRVLSSGLAASASRGSDMLRQLVAAAPTNLTMIAGAGVRAANVKQLVLATGVTEVHLSALQWQPSAMRFRRAGVPMASAVASDEYQRRATSADELGKVLAALATAPRPPGPTPNE